MVVLTLSGKMNVDEYFTRIGFHGPCEKPELATLKLIHKQHVMTIPFENLSIHCSERITTDLEFIFNKIVRSSRGGWCCENNLMFDWVLKELGYNATMLGARVFNCSTNEFSPTDSHLINKVVIDGKAYIADVSFGLSGQIWEPMELASEKEQPQPSGVFRLIEQGEIWTLEKTVRKPKILNPDFANSILVDKGKTQQIYCFSLVVRGVDHFLEMTHRLQTDPCSLFTNKSICSLQTATGFRALIGWTYGEFTFKPAEAFDLLDMKDIPDDEIEQVLREKFHVKLVNKLVPINNKGGYTL